MRGSVHCKRAGNRQDLLWGAHLARRPPNAKERPPVVYTATELGEGLMVVVARDVNIGNDDPDTRGLHGRKTRASDAATSRTESETTMTTMQLDSVQHHYHHQGRRRQECEEHM